MSLFLKWNIRENPNSKSCLKMRKKIINLCYELTQANKKFIALILKLVLS